MHITVLYSIYFTSNVLLASVVGGHTLPGSENAAFQTTESWVIAGVNTEKLACKFYRFTSFHKCLKVL